VNCVKHAPDSDISRSSVLLNPSNDLTIRRLINNQDNFVMTITPDIFLNPDFSCFEQPFRAGFAVVERDKGTITQKCFN
jgi:hypothetical protein